MYGQGHGAVGLQACYVSATRGASAAATGASLLVVAPQPQKSVNGTKYGVVRHQCASECKAVSSTKPQLFKH